MATDDSGNPTESMSNFDSRLLETRRHQHKLRLGLGHVPLLTLADALQGRSRAAIVEAVVRIDDESTPAGCPSRMEVQTQLAARYRFVYAVRSQPDHPEFPLRWCDSGLTAACWRTWFVVSPQPIEHEELIPDLPKRQWVAEQGSQSRFQNWPAIRPGMTKTDLGGGCVELSGESERYVLRGLEADTVIAIDGGSSADTLAATVASKGRWSQAEVHYALARLAQRGLTEEAGARFGEWEEEFWRRAKVRRDVASRRMAEAKVAVSGPDLLRDAVARHGLRLTDSPGDATVHLVAVRDYVDGTALDTRNREARECGRPWMLTKLDGAIAWIGPIFRPGVTPCWRCLAMRLEENRSTGLRSGAASAVTQRVAAELAATTLARWIGTAGGPPEGQLITFDTLTLTPRIHPVLRHYRCPHCCVAGDAPVPMKDELPADESPEPLEKLAQRLRRLVSPLTGLIQEAYPVSGSEPLHVFFGRVNGALGAPANIAARRNEHWQAMGKSRDRLKAEVACLAEAIERHSSGFHPGEPLVRRRWQDWTAGEAVHPESVVLYSKAQQADLKRWNARSSRANRVCPPFQEDQEFEWRQVWSVTREKPRWMIAGLCFVDYPIDPARRFHIGDSNGCAAGRTKADALLRGLLELIERDAVAIWWYNRLPRPAVRPDLSAVVEGRTLLQHRKRTLEVLDLTTDTGIPAAVAVSCRVDTGDQILLGFGADLSVERAAEKAVEELCLLLPWPGNRI
jgi:bacteriocin biosynthesis cyclodehydratase domain-containing protein